MRDFCFGFLLLYSLLSTYIIILLYKRLKKKVSKQDIEDYLLDNFLDLDL